MHRALGLIREAKVAALVLALCLSLTAIPAYAANNWPVTDACGPGPTQGNPYFWVDGPVSNISTWEYTGGQNDNPYNGGADGCATFSWNVPSFGGYAIDETAHWYFPVSPSYTNYYYLWPFVPNLGLPDLTTYAQYQIWPTGHCSNLNPPPYPTCGTYQYICAPNQQSHQANLWVALADNAVEPCSATFQGVGKIWMCSDSTSNCGGSTR